MLLDSGASANFCDKRVAMDLLQNGSADIAPICSTVRLPDNRLIAVNEEVSAIIKISNFTWKLSFLIVSDLSFPFIMGSNSLKKIQAHINFANSYLSFSFNPNIKIRFINPF